MGQCQNQNLDLYDVKAKEYRIDREESKELTRLRANLGMKWSDISRIHGAYNILDLDDSGWISRAEFLRVVGCEPSDFGNEIFRIFDSDKNNKLCFTEFVGGCAMVCSSDKYALVRFAFRLVDIDGSGFLDVAELETVCNIVYGSTMRKSDGFYDVHIRRGRRTILGAMEALDTDRSGKVSMREFLQAVIKSPQLVRPAFELQQKLKKKVVGEAFWDARAKKLQKRFAKLDRLNRSGDFWGAYVQKFSEAGGDLGNTNARNRVLGTANKVAPEAGGRMAKQGQEPPVPGRMKLPPLKNDFIFSVHKWSEWAENDELELKQIKQKEGRGIRRRKSSGSFRRSPI
eukprot:CAMPEP_0172642670 /NCGR_PEP_ID=MMETSP1068-20121228/233259_1 /TAXON_ID=35684 /ORGANISM="Pseudopedinella elastica, Strain CCMP716" /LENGTH=342 /DNA_ID=CAMNT_0013456541 /DNA_START=50 /DNA_END=1078 /DNA_ORIENTATION=+